jgi:hypothetical protein
LKEGALGSCFSNSFLELPSYPKPLGVNYELVASFLLGVLSVNPPEAASSAATAKSETSDLFASLGYLPLEGVPTLEFLGIFTFLIMDSRPVFPSNY